MLTLTENASTIIKDIAEQIPEASGLRISGGEGEEPAFEVAPAEQPLSRATRPSSRAARPSSSTRAPPLQLDDKVLDAAVDQAGNVQFALGLQG